MRTYIFTREDKLVDFQITEDAKFIKRKFNREDLDKRNIIIQGVSKQELFTLRNQIDELLMNLR